MQSGSRAAAGVLLDKKQPLEVTGWGCEEDWAIETRCDEFCG
jgi:hypothetical protein